MTSSQTPHDDHARLWDLIKDIRFGMLTHRHDDGLLAVRIANAEYWDVADSKMVQVYKMMKAAATGVPPKEMGEHRKLDLG